MIATTTCIADYIIPLYNRVQSNPIDPNARVQVTHTQIAPTASISIGSITGTITRVTPHHIRVVFSTGVTMDFESGGRMVWFDNQGIHTSIHNIPREVLYACCLELHTLNPHINILIAHHKVLVWDEHDVYEYCSIRKNTNMYTLSKKIREAFGRTWLVHLK